VSTTVAPVLLARQPILDRHGRIRGYELLFRGPGPRPLGGVAGDRATAQVLVSALSDLDLPALTGGRPAWVNVSRDFLLAFDPLPLSPTSVVLELLEGALVDRELLDRVARLRSEGFLVALDDFVPTKGSEPLVSLATHVKLDVQALGLDEFGRAVEAVSRAGAVTIVAEKVERPEERDACEELGADLFQGFYFARPRDVPGTRVPTGPLVQLRTAVELYSGLGFEALEQAIVSDPGLTVRLLRYVGSAAVGSRRRVGSVREALTLLGSTVVRQWALLVLLSDVGVRRPAVIASGLLRGRMCETLARDAAVGAEATSEWFAVGVLSIVDALLDAPLSTIVPALPLVEDVQRALLTRTGPMGETLDLVLRLERGEAMGAEPELAHLGEAVLWTERTLAGMVAS